MKLKHAIPTDPKVIDWLSRLDHAKHREIIADFDLREPLDRGLDRAAGPDWKLVNGDGTLHDEPWHGYVFPDYSSLEVVAQRIGLDPLYRTMRRIHVVKDGFFIARLWQGEPGDWSFYHRSTLTAHDLFEIAHQFEMDHPDY